MTDAHLAVLRHVDVDEGLLAHVLACAYTGMGNRSGDVETCELARTFYVEALAATLAALENPRKAHEDNVLLSVLLLSLFEVSIHGIFTNDASLTSGSYSTGRDPVIRRTTPGDNISMEQHISCSCEVLTFWQRNWERSCIERRHITW